MERQNNAKWLRGKVGPLGFESWGVPVCQYQYSNNDYGQEDVGFDAIGVNSSGGRDDLSEYCGGDHHGQIDRVHDVIFMMMMMMIYVG